MTYWQPVCWTIWNDVWRENTLSHNAQLHFGQLEDCIFCVSLATLTCNVWRNMLSCICQNIRRHFKHSVDTLIVTVTQVVMVTRFWAPGRRCFWRLAWSAALVCLWAGSRRASYHGFSRLPGPRSRPLSNQAWKWRQSWIKFVYNTPITLYFCLILLFREISN